MSVLERSKGHGLPPKKQAKSSILPVVNTVINRTTTNTPIKKEDFGAPLAFPTPISEDNDNGKNKAVPRTVSPPPPSPSSADSVITFKNGLRVFEIIALGAILIVLSIFFHDWLMSGATATSTNGGACVPKCTLSSDITPVQFLTGVTNVTYVCYRGSSQIIYTPPTDPLNYDFSTSSYNAALTVCQKSVKQTFAIPPSFIPYMANDPTGQANGVYTRCSLVWECSFSYFT